VSSLQKLYESPLETAKEYAVVVSGAISDVREKHTDASHDLTFMQVYASRPVYAKCKAKAGYLRIEATDHGTDGTRVYFLPWSIGSIYRIRPKFGDTPGLNENLFFTPNLDGCMVTVEGTQQNPTIYHANAKNPTLNRFEKALLKDVAQKRKEGNVGEHDEGKVENMIKIGKMKADQVVFSKILPKKPSPPVLNPPAKAHFDLLEYDLGSKEEYSTTKLEIKGMRPLEGLPTKSIDVHCGAVFGVRKDGAWTFYKQSYRLVTSTTWKGDTGQPMSVEACTYSVAKIDQFWP
jgi:hypothetical protein